MNFSAGFLAIATVLGALGGAAGLTALARVFVVDRHVVKRDDMTAERTYSSTIRTELEEEITARRADRVWFEAELKKRDETIQNLRNSWDACRAECQRLRALVQGETP